jgi:chaperonin GroES
MSFRPLHGPALVPRVEDDEKTMGGTFIPDTGKIVPLNVKVGDRVLFVKWSGGEPKVRLARYLRRMRLRNSGGFAARPHQPRLSPHQRRAMNDQRKRSREAITGRGFSCWYKLMRERRHLQT